MLLRSGIIVAFFTLISRFFGLARELFIAATFGTTFIADCVNVAFKFPNLFRRIFGEGALSVVFIPMFSEKLVSSKKDAKKFSGEVFTLLLLTLIILTMLLQITMPYLMIVIAPGFFVSGEKFDLAVTLCRITIPYVIFVSITALFGGMLNSIRQFAAFAFVPVLMNICIITITPLIQDTYTAHFGIAYALIIAGILQVAFMYYCLTRAGLNFPLLFRPKDKDVTILLKKMGPATMSSGAQQINLFISQSIASFLPGAVSILSYADRLYQLPMSLIGVTFGTILLPELSRMYKKKQHIEANNLQNKSIKIAAAISIPAMCGLFVLATPIIHFIYERGQFTANDTLQTSYALMAFSLGLPAFILGKILTPIFYANLDTKTPFKITIYSIITNVTLNILLMIPFGHVGIALGSTIAAWLNVYLLNKHAKQYGNFQIGYDTLLFSLKIIICSVFMVGFIVLTQYYLNDFFYTDRFIIKAGMLLGTIGCAIIIFAIFGYFFKIHKLLFDK
ncbi:MAG: murein biosynthesis integral membrane protein MurJ [Rickettsiaceae bacterium]|nr:murein biosynthesis integral membrane protein MurJ [Rickettsiaceae bacterium]MDP4832894.1 murein biosynthesis integral membrane protein MurJ [Rickettsiaceae bacterium]MDP5020111.1 murein biosynthesis integral membrane protein MurJ [Rickettsiaceae bacterium]MDP5083691.1 murein biosynthesis integral membrane protein MurJ [Rickettsiaceae bacterium]